MADTTARYNTEGARPYEPKALVISGDGSVNEIFLRETESVLVPSVRGAPVHYSIWNGKRYRTFRSYNSNHTTIVLLEGSDE